MMRTLLLALLVAALSKVAWAADQRAQAAKLNLCASCHGAQGEGNPAMNAPRLAGQWADYLARQLAAYADGSRDNPVMAPVAKGLDEPTRRALASYYANLAPSHPRTPASESEPERGSKLATLGDGEKRIQACANCHGPEGSGEPPLYPYLAGQRERYLVAALHAWRDNTRNTDPTRQMNTIARQLSEADMEEVARYYAAKQPPMPAWPPRAPARPKPGREGKGAAPSQGQGVGSDQGAGTTGGGQGPGGGGGTQVEGQ